MRLLALCGLVVLACGCDATYTIRFADVPHCPVSDSAKAKADSVPVPCLFADSVKR